MFSNIGSMLGMYSGSPLVSAVSSATMCRVNGRFVPCSEAFNFLAPFLIVFAPIFAFMALIGIAVCVLMIISWWKVFQKAGRPGWAAIVPIYNIVVMLQTVGMSPWLVLLAFVPFVGGLVMFIVFIFLNIKLAKLFGKDEGFAVGLILLPVVFVPILAFGQARFMGTKAATDQTPPAPQNTPVPPTPPVSPSSNV